MHRAHSMLQLLLTSRSVRPAEQEAWHDEYALASRLACEYRSLFASRESELVPCERVLRGVVHNLGLLFGPVAGGVEVRVSIEQTLLVAVRRRALALLTSELLLNAFGHAFPGCVGGRAEVCLERMSEGYAVLRVSDNGVGYAQTADDAGASIVERLSALLGGRLVCRQDRRAGTTAEIVFPVVWQAPGRAD
jgi:two-component sensor histidine kinase